MPSTDRIQTASITSPSGYRAEFQYENVSLKSNIKTGAFIFPDVDGQYIQNRGRGGRNFPLTMFFSGPDCDIDADFFLAALEEKGIFKLDHPKYGVRYVVPTGEIDRADGLVSEANQVTFTVTFAETIKDINFPSSQVSEESEIGGAAEFLNNTASDQYASNLVPDSESETATLQNDIISKKDESLKQLDPISQLNADIANNMKAISESMNNNILTLVTNPGGIASQVMTLLNAPANAGASADAALNGYGGLINAIASGSVESVGQYFNALIFSSGAFSGLVNSLLNAVFGSRPEAVDALTKTGDLVDTITDFIDTQNEKVGYNDTGEIYAAINDLYAKISGYLIRLSFDLPKKIYITLIEDRQLIELITELYPKAADNIDYYIDFFITTNDLTTDEIELLPMGGEYVYFE